MLGLTRYQWLVLFAAWLGWGFDVFDGLLFNYVAPICVPNLLGLPPGDPANKGITVYWTSILTSMLLLGWAIGGILFGQITDKLGRARTLLITMLVYSVATAACAFAPNLWVLAALRFVASLGIGGEWAAGAALVAEALPDRKRVLGGALLYTSAPAGLFLATFVNDLFTRNLESIASNPNWSWRAVFLTGLVPAFVAILIRLRLRESEAWKPALQPKIRELFTPALRARTLGGLAMAVTALVTWWSLSAFTPLVASFLVNDLKPALPAAEMAARRTEFITLGSSAFNLGGLIGTLLTVPIAMHLGRRPMFFLYFLASAATIFMTFGLDWEPETRLRLLFPVGVAVFGVFGSFTFYLPELFPVELRGTGAGFTYNIGRVITACFPFAIGWAATSGANPLAILSFVALAPLVGVAMLLAGVAVETRGQQI